MSMTWRSQLGKDSRGSRPRCVLLVDGKREEVASRLTRLVGHPAVTVSHNDCWWPYGKPAYKEGSWDNDPVQEAELVKVDILSHSQRRDLRKWWLAVNGRARTPTWDIASSCKIHGESGVLLVEAKAHRNELWRQADKCHSKRPENRERICRAIAKAAAGLQSVTGNPWNISSETHYQLANRFAWSWKIASLGMPVVLVYLGFLNADEMEKDGEVFHSAQSWEDTLKSYGEGIVDNSCWGKWLEVGGVPFLPLIQADDQPLMVESE